MFTDDSFEKKGFDAETFEAKGGFDRNCKVCKGTGWMPKKGDPKDAKTAKLLGLSIDELTMQPCNAGGKDMGCFNAESFSAEKFPNKCFICLKDAKNQRPFMEVQSEPSLADKEGNIWLCNHHNNMLDFGLFAKGNILSWTHPNGTKYRQGRLLKMNAESFEARDDSWCVNHGWIRGTKIGDIIPCSNCNDMICDGCRCGGCGNCETSDCCECDQDPSMNAEEFGVEYEDDEKHFRISRKNDGETIAIIDVEIDGEYSNINDALDAICDEKNRNVEQIFFGAESFNAEEFGVEYEDDEKHFRISRKNDGETIAIIDVEIDGEYSNINDALDAICDEKNRNVEQIFFGAESFSAENRCSICSGTGHNSRTCPSPTMSICGKCGGSDFISESYYDGQIYCQKCEVFIPTNELKTVKNPKWKEMFGAERSGLTRLPSDEPNFSPQKADRNKDGEISSWERTVGNKVAKGIREGRKTSSKGIDTFAEPFEEIGISKPYARLGVIAAGITALAFGVNKLRK